MTSATREVSDGLAARIASVCHARSAEAWDLLEALVAVDSPPDDRSGLETLATMMVPVWQRLGFEVSLHSVDGDPPVVMAERFVGEDRPTVLILGHLDTVFPSGTVARRPMARSGGRATGPGVADMKGGLVVGWLALASAIEITGGLDTVNIRMLNNVDEEAGSVRSRPIIESWLDEVDVALVLEPGRPDGSVVIGRRGVRRYTVLVEGRAAHTGVEPWNGANAIEELSDKVLRLQALSDRSRSLSVTVAKITGGTRINIVPDAARCEVDVRVADLETMERVHASIEEIVASTVVEGTSSRYELGSERPPMNPQPVVAELVALLQQGAADLGVELEATVTGGASDGCFTSALGIPTLDGLGPVGGGYHTDSEYLHEESLVERAAIVGTFLSALRMSHLATPGSHTDEAPMDRSHTKEDG